MNNKEAKQVLIGTLLGDGSIEKSGVNSFRFKGTQGIIQKDYALFKCKILDSLVKTKWKEVNVKGGWYKKKFFKERVSIILRSLSSSFFKKYYHMFYQNGKKEVSTTILNRLEPLGLAIWYLDDGSYQYGEKAIYLSTHSFGLEGNKVIKKWFKKNHGIQVNIHPHENHYMLRMNVVSSKKFIEMIKKFVLKCMNYKLGTDKERIKIAEKRIKEYKKNHKEYFKKWRKKHRLKKREYDKEYNQQNKEKIKKRRKKYYEKNREILLKKQNKHNQILKVNKRKKEYMRKYYQKNKSLKKEND